MSKGVWRREGASYAAVVVACLMFHGALARAQTPPSSAPTPPPADAPATAAPPLGITSPTAATPGPVDTPPPAAAAPPATPAPADAAPPPPAASDPVPPAAAAYGSAPAPAPAPPATADGSALAPAAPAPVPPVAAPAPAAPAAPAGGPATDATPVAPPPPGNVAKSNANMDSTYLKLREIEERVNRLKEQVFQSKARLVQLQEVVLHGSIAGAKLILIHRDEMGSSFKLSHVQYALDGTVIFNRLDAEAAELEKQEEMEVFNGPVAPGNHQLAVYLEYVGNGFGVFSYLEGYRFKIKSSYTLMADEGKVTTVRIVGFEKGGVTTELKDRPSVRFDVAMPADLGAATVGGSDAGAGSSPPKASTPAPTP